MTALPSLETTTQRSHAGDPPPAFDEPRRAAALRAHGASSIAIDELLAYGASAFNEETLLDPPPIPVADEPFAQAWDEYQRDARVDGVFESLRRRLVQLNFPVELGMSGRAEYQAATRRGLVERAHGDGLRLNQPDGLELSLHQTAAGRIPVIVVANRVDFVSLIQALTRRNEPEPIPDSMGACIVGGYNNWDRVRRLRADWEASSPDDPSDAEWNLVFRSITATHRELYQDRFIVLSSGPYSATPANVVGVVGEVHWRRLSGTIRLEHECTHYFTRRIFGSMRNTILDELCADYAGIVAACGHFRPDWFLRFVGLEDADTYRAGGRLENYRGTPALSNEAFEVLQRVVRVATAQLAHFDATRRRAGPLPVANVVIALARVGLEPLATERGSSLLDAELRQLDAR
ncbi:MAG: hypothetical protein ABI625_03040 [bacterium]